MRKPNDNCLLCLVNKADKKNSHILPKYLSSKLFGSKESKKGFQISNDRPIEKSKKIVQDSPKEDYILCSECESYLGILERLSSSFFLTWRSNINHPNFNIKSMAENCSLLVYNNPNTKSLKLLIYSIFWRASISSNDMFNNIQINKRFENKLRKTILTYKTIKQNELKHSLNGKSNFEIFPFTIITAESFKDETSNILYVPFYNGAYRLIVDQYTFLLFRNKSEIPAKLFEYGGNLKAEDCKMLIFSIELWQKNIIQPAMDNLAKMIKETNNKSR